MTDKVQKIKDWISREQEGLMDAQGNFEYPEHQGAYDVLCNLDAYIDSLQEEPVSEDLEEAATQYGIDNFPSLCNGCKRVPVDAFKAGTKWKKQQMMTKTVETTFNVSLPSGLYDKLRIKGCKNGDKLLAIKKDEL